MSRNGRNGLEIDVWYSVSQARLISFRNVKTLTNFDLSCELARS